MYTVIFLRHGESTWNKENRFTGWTDVDLSEKGIEEAHRAGQLIKEAGFTFDVAFTSVLKAGHQNLVDSSGRDGPDVYTGQPVVETERAALWCPAGTGQGRDHREVWKRSGSGMAAWVCNPATGAYQNRSPSPRKRSPVRHSYR